MPLGGSRPGRSKVLILPPKEKDVPYLEAKAVDHGTMFYLPLESASDPSASSCY